MALPYPIFQLRCHLSVDGNKPVNFMHPINRNFIYRAILAQFCPKKKKSKISCKFNKKKKKKAPKRASSAKILWIWKHFFFREILHSISQIGELSHLHCQISYKSIKASNVNVFISPFSVGSIVWSLKSFTPLPISNDGPTVIFFTVFVLNLEDIWKVPSLKRMLFKSTLSLCCYDTNFVEAGVVTILIPTKKTKQF